MIATAATDTIIATVYMIAAILWVHTNMWADYPQRPVKVWNT